MAAHNDLVFSYHYCSKRASIPTADTLISLLHGLGQKSVVSIINSCQLEIQKDITKSPGCSITNSCDELSTAWEKLMHRIQFLLVCTGGKYPLAMCVWQSILCIRMSKCLCMWRTVSINFLLSLRISRDKFLYVSSILLTAIHKVASLFWNIQNHRRMISKRCNSKGEILGIKGPNLLGGLECGEEPQWACPLCLPLPPTQSNVRTIPLQLL